MKKRLINTAEKKKIKDILKRELSHCQEVIFAYLYGSFLLPVPCADVDIAVYLDEAALSPKHWEYEAKLAVSLEPLVGMPVDVLTLNYVHVALRYHATCGKVLVSKNEPARFTFLEKTWREYFDYQPFFKDYLNDLSHEQNT